MARGPGKARDFDYSNVGTAGRRTGITLKEGRRDEHGMEEVEGIFSSPEKSPAKLNGFTDAEDGSSIGSDGMSMDEGNAPDPMDFLNGANRPRNSYFPPPTARSPVKSGLTGSPRRTPRLRSSPDPQNDLASSPSDGKGLAGTQGASRHEPSPLTARSVNAGRSNQKNGVRRKLKAQLTASEPAVVHDFSDGEGDENADAFAPIQHDFDDNYDSGNDSMVGENLPDSTENAQNDPDGDSFLRAVGSHRKDQIAPTPKSTKKNAASKNPKGGKDGAKSMRRPGRPPKSQRFADEEAADPRPAKRPKTSGRGSQTAREPLDPELDRVVENYANRAGPLKGRSLYILKREVPTDTTATHTRSGRVSVRPLAYWRNERCVYGDGEAPEGRRYPLSTIKEVIRTEEVEPETKKKGKGVTSRKSKNRRGEASDEEDEEIDLWEKEGGVLHGYVLRWDAQSQTSTKEEEVLDIAYAPSGIETREVKDSTFRFAKLLSSSFIGSGVVELPPGGVKKPKNSKKMHMVFYVCHGRVQVDVSGVQFSAGKGCVFQVPRGNYYSFANTHEREARLFFTQGCVPAEGDASPPSASRGAGQESEFEPDNVPAAAPAGKGRGRPKGKQRAGK